MNNLTKVLSVIGLGAALTVASFAQSAGPSGGAVIPQGQSPQHDARKGGGNKWMFETERKILKQLGLSPDQESKLKDLDKKTMDELKELREKNRAAGKPADKDAARSRAEAMKAIMKEHRDGLLAVLTPDQKKKFKELWKQAIKEHREAMISHGGGRVP